MTGLVREHGADVGVALDGDADRVIMCDEQGAIVDGDGILAICAFHLHAKGKLAQDTVVGTAMSNMGLEAALAKRGIRLLRTNVGDRYVMEVMRREGLNLGGESSGHIIFLHHQTSGDGVLAALRILSIMRQRKEPLSAIRAEYVPYPQVTENVAVARKVPFDRLPGVMQAIAAARESLMGEGRVLVRYSGTEAIARVMVEGPQEEGIRLLSDEIAAAIRQELGNAARA